MRNHDFLIYNANIHTMDGPLLQSGYLHVSDGKIRALGHMSDCPNPAAYNSLDAHNGHLLPGFIDAHCHLGIIPDSSSESEDCNEEYEPITPYLRAIDGLNPMDRCFQEAREGGITTVLTGPGSANPIGGQFAALKTNGRRVDDMLLASPANIKFALGENPKNVYGNQKKSPATRMATAALIREALFRAQEYLAKRESGQKPDFHFTSEALLPLLRREVPAHFHAHRADDILTAIRIAREFNLDPVIVHGTEGHLIADILAKENVPVIAGPVITDRSKPELRHLSLENVATLQNAGVLTAVCTDHPVTPIQYLPLCAAMAMKTGLDPEEALRTITLYPARILRLDHRIGSLSVGKDADLVLCDRHPFDLCAQMTAVWISGIRI